MADPQANQYATYLKQAWRIYALIALIIVTLLVLLVARDTEEMFFYGLLTPAAFYVFRPTERYIGRLVFKFTGVSKPEEKQ